jgi:aldehyde:ferredoxin oxidoreductase
MEPDKKYVAEGTGPLDLKFTASMELLNAAGLCMFGQFAGVSPAAMLEAVTGRAMDKEEQQRTGLRMLTMRHVFNVREGQKPDQCKLPDRLVGEPPQTDGPLKGVTVDHKGYLKNWCQAMGWDETTWKPSREGLAALGGLDPVIQEFHG